MKIRTLQGTGSVCVVAIKSNDDALDIYDTLLNLPDRIDTGQVEYEQNDDATFQVEVFFRNPARALAAAAYIREYVKATNTAFS